MTMEISHIWLAHFPSEERLDAYFAEHYDDGPINTFAQEQGENFYDHDWLEMSFSKNTSLHDLIIKHSYSDHYLNKVLEDVGKMGDITANVFVMADVEEFAEPRSVKGRDYTVWYIGKYPCDIDED